MSIWMYTGTPGSGKSLHVSRRILRSLTLYKMPVIANFPVNMDVVSRNGKKKTAKFTYKKNSEITVPYLVEYALEHHKAGVESQTLIVIDEAGIKFNSRLFSQSDRMDWVDLFANHRHYGFDIILVTQFDRMIDRQIRALVEYEIKHRKANNFGWIGFLCSIFRIPLFVAIEVWYGMGLKTGTEFFRYRKRDSKLYDTMMLFGGNRHGRKIGEAPAPVTDGGGDPERSEEGPRHRPERGQGTPDAQPAPDSGEQPEVQAAS